MALVLCGASTVIEIVFFCICCARHVVGAADVHSIANCSSACSSMCHDVVILVLS
jgi:hypothetical protein